MLLNAVWGELAFELYTGGEHRWRLSSSDDNFVPRASVSMVLGKVTLPNAVGVDDCCSPSADGGVVRIP